MQRNFNDSVNASTKNISLHELFEKVNFDRFIAIGTTFPYNTKITVCEKVVKQYLTAISFGYAKKRSEEHFASKQTQCKKSLRANLKQQHGE